MGNRENQRVGIPHDLGHKETTRFDFPCFSGRRETKRDHSIDALLFGPQFPGCPYPLRQGSNLCRVNEKTFVSNRSTGAIRSQRPAMCFLLPLQLLFGAKLWAPHANHPAARPPRHRELAKSPRPRPSHLTLGNQTINSWFPCEFRDRDPDKCLDTNGAKAKIAWSNLSPAQKT